MVIQYLIGARSRLLIKRSNSVSSQPLLIRGQSTICQPHRTPTPQILKRVLPDRMITVLLR